MENRPLEGFAIGITADRRADEQAAMLRRRGATVVLGPTLRTLPLGPDERLRDATEALISRPPDVLVANTGIGIRSWLGAAESWGLLEQVMAALAGTRIVARGPKAKGAIIAAGLRADWTAASERLDELVAHLESGPLAGVRIALQLDGGHDRQMSTRLAAAGAEMLDLPVYRWTWPDDLAPARRLLRAACAAELDAVTFTAAPAVRNLFALAERDGLADELRAALSGPVLAMCVGSVCREAAESCGFTTAVEPQRGRLGSMVQSLTEQLGDRRTLAVVGDHVVAFQGSSVTVDGTSLSLSPLERGVLHALCRQPDAVVSKPQLLADVWCSDRRDVRAVEMTVTRLRKRIAGSGLQVVAVPRRGYRLAACAPQPA